MFELKYISKWGGTLDLAKNDLFTLTNVDGLTVAASDIASIVIGGIDGDIVNNIQAQPRGIIFDLRIKNGVNVESAKRAVLDIVKLKQTGTLHWTQNGRTFVIQGVVDTVTMPRFSNEVTMQISLHCGEPFWEDLNEVITEISDTIPLQYFTSDPYDMLYFPDSGIPFSVYDTSRTRTFNNTGDVAVGMIIQVYALGTVTNPIIYNHNGEFFGIGTNTNPVVLQEGDTLIINTKTGEKSVYLISGLNKTNMIDNIKPFSVWLQLHAGENEFRIDSNDSATDNMIFTLQYKQRYI